MNNFKYNKEIIDKFKKQFNDIHKKCQRQLQVKSSDRLTIFLNKRIEIFDLIYRQREYNMVAFSYVYNDYVNYIHKLNYKINREVLKHKRFLIITSSNRFRKGKI